MNWLRRRARLVHRPRARGGRKPLHAIEEEEGPFERPWACVNHLFPFHLARRPLRLPPRAGHGWTWDEAETALWTLVATLAARESATETASARAAVATCARRAGELDLDRPWWSGAESFLASRLQATGVFDELDESVRRRYLPAWMRLRHRHEVLERRLADLLAELAGLGREALVLKGLGFARVWYPEPAARPCGDIDLLVRAPDLEPIVARLTQRGWRAIGDERPEFWSAHHHARPLVFEQDREPVLLELHTRLASEIDDPAWLAELWAGSDRVAGPHGPIPVPSAVDRLAHAMAHHTVELTFKGALDLVLAAHVESPETWRAAAERLPASLRWRAVLAAGLARDLGGVAAPLAALPPAWVAAVERACVPAWGGAHAAWMCRADGRERPRHWLEGFAPRVDEVCRQPRAFGRGGSALRASALYVGRQTRLVGRIAGDVLSFVFPPRATVSGSYLANSARAAKSAASRLANGLRGPHGSGR